MSKSPFERLASATAPTLMFESVPASKAEGAGVPAEDAEITEAAMFESLDSELMTEAVSKAALASIRSTAMAALFTFADEGMNTASELDSLAVGMADVDDDGDVSESEQEDYEQAVNALVEALQHIGVSEKLINAAIKDESDDAADEIALHIAAFLDDIDDEDKYIAEYSVRENLMMEAVKKVVRDGKVQWIKKPLRKRRLTSAQRNALKKARRKANTGAAKRARAKSMRLRQKSGMK